MKIEYIKKELSYIIDNLEYQITEEKKSSAKSANYEILTNRLEEAKDLESDISESEKLGLVDTNLYEFRLKELQNPFE